MKIATYLRKQLTDFVDCYELYYRKTFRVSISLAFICLLTAAVLFKFSVFDKASTTKQLSLLSYLFNSYSKMDTYSIVDFVKLIFIFLISLFSIAIDRWTNQLSSAAELSLTIFAKCTKPKELVLLLFILMVSAAIDFSLFTLDTFSLHRIQNKALDQYLHLTIFHLRIYIPLLLFSISIYFLKNSRKYKFTLKRLAFLYVSLWLFNEFAYESFLWTRNHVYDLILIPLSETNYIFVTESIIGIPLIAFYFLGYHSAMANSLKLTEPQT